MAAVVTTIDVVGHSAEHVIIYIFCNVEVREIVNYPCDQQVVDFQEQ